MERIYINLIRTYNSTGDSEDYLELLNTFNSIHDKIVIQLHGEEQFQSFLKVNFDYLMDSDFLIADIDYERLQCFIYTRLYSSESIEDFDELINQLDCTKYDCNVFQFLIQ
jgi:hypothetical protein